MPNTNGEYLIDFLFENCLSCLYTKFQKTKGKLWTNTNINNPKTQRDYILINKKWINSALNFVAYPFFEGVSFDHRIVTAKIRLSLRRNKKKKTVKNHTLRLVLTN